MEIELLRWLEWLVSACFLNKFQLLLTSTSSGLTGKRWPVIGRKLHPEFPYIDAEVRYGVREYACTAVDMIARRMRLAFLNSQAALEALPGIIDIMAEELGWSEAEKKV